jgi:hypothetical protein
MVAVGSGLTVTAQLDKLLNAPLVTVQEYVVDALGLTEMLWVVNPPGNQRKVAPGAAFVFAVRVIAFPLQTLGFKGEMAIVGV